MTIVYLLLVLREVRGDAGEGEVQHLAVAAGSLLALACVLALVWFLQGVSSLIVADEVARRVRREFDRVLDRLPTSDEPARAGSFEPPPDFETRCARLRLPREGYVQSVEFHQILAWAERHGALVPLDFRPGDFVVDADRKVLVYPAPEDAEAVRRRLGRFIVSGPARTPDQDIEFAIRHLVEVAVTALSPGVNDPFTAVAVVDRLRGAIARLAGRSLPVPVLRDGEGVARVIRRVSDFGGVLDAAFDQIRQAAAGKPSVLIHMLRAINGLAEHLETDEQRSALRRQVDLIGSSGAAAVEESDRADIEREHRRALAALAAGR